MVKFNDKFFEELQVSAEVEALVVEAAEGVAEIARATAPVDTEDYRNGISVTTKHQRRVVALVVSSDWKTFLIESKTGNLVRALRAYNRKQKRS